MTPEEEAFWSSYQAATGNPRRPHDSFAFGDSAELAGELLTLVLDGTKQATACRLAIYRQEGLRPPEPGDLAIVKDGEGRPACVIETVHTEIAAFNTATEEFARVEGEGDKTLAWWRAAHLDYFGQECAREGSSFDENEPIVFHRFRLAWTPRR